MLKQISTNGLFGLATALGGGYGEHLKTQLIMKEIRYEWYMGHLTDLCWSATMVSLGAIGTLYSLYSDKDFKDKNYENRNKDFNTLDSIVLGTAGLVAAGCTFVEYLDSTVGVAFDWKDVVAYTLGTGAAYAVYKMSRYFERSSLSPSNLPQKA